MDGREFSLFTFYNLVPTSVYNQILNLKHETTY